MNKFCKNKMFCEHLFYVIMGGDSSHFFDTNGLGQFSPFYRSWMDAYNLSVFGDWMRTDLGTVFTFSNSCVFILKT